MLSFCFGGTLVTSCAVRLSVARARRARMQEIHSSQQPRL